MKLSETQYIYRHFKGGLYVVVGEAQHTETLEDLVLYQDCDHDHSPNKTWARPRHMFYHDRVDNPDGLGTVPRFKKVGFVDSCGEHVFFDKGAEDNP